MKIKLENFSSGLKASPRSEGYIATLVRLVGGEPLSLLLTQSELRLPEDSKFQKKLKMRLYPNLGASKIRAKIHGGR